jgi:hypothetical protein
LISDNALFIRATDSILCLFSHQTKFENIARGRVRWG